MKFKDYLIESEYVKKGNQIVPKEGWYVKIGRKTTYKNDYQLVKNITEFKDFLEVVQVLALVYIALNIHKLKVAK